MSISCYFPCSTRKMLYKICNLTFHLSPVGGRESNFWNCATQLFPAGKPLNHFSSFFFPDNDSWLRSPPSQPRPRKPLGGSRWVFAVTLSVMRTSCSARSTGLKMIRKVQKEPRRVPESTFIWRRRRSPGPRHRHGLTYGVCASVRARL